jgi:hypothetical protein
MELAQGARFMTELRPYHVDVVGEFERTVAYAKRRRVA